MNGWEAEKKVIVKYHFSTSNHNPRQLQKTNVLIVKYHFSTSNHNKVVRAWILRAIVKYHFSTSNHNPIFVDIDLRSVVKYHFSTSNHNLKGAVLVWVPLSNITFLHQTTTQSINKQIYEYCQISLFYIKPQRSNGISCLLTDCQISLFYIKPQPSV